MRSFLCMLALLLVFSPVSEGQEAPLLYPAGKVDITGLVGLFANPSCDADGNVYLEAWGGQRPIIELSPDGKVLAKFSLSSVPGQVLKHGWLQSFSIDPWGNVFALVSNWKSGEAHIVEFDSDGEYEETIKLKSKGIFPYHLAVFPTHDFLVTGVNVGSGTLPKGATQTNFFTGSFTAVFNPYGELVKEVSPPEDVSKKEAVKEAAKGHKGSLSGATSNDNAFAEVIGKGGAIAGPDGNVYLVRASRPPLVYVISSNGNVIRRMVLHPPAPGLSPWLRGMAEGRFVLSFQAASSGPEPGIKRPTTVEWYSLYDVQTGDNIVNYKLSPKLNGAFVCSTGNDFVFISKQGQRTYLIHAKPR